MATNINHSFSTSHSGNFYETIFAARADQEIRIVLAGKTGEGKSPVDLHFALRSSYSSIVGKSAMGNAILGHSPFVAKRSMKSETSFCQVGERNLDGRRVIVVDTPGLFDTNADPHHVAKEIGKAVMMSSPGPHCFIVTISARNRFTEEAQQTVNLLHDIFGGDVLSYCIVVFTNEDAITDEGMTFDNWLPEQTGQLPGLAHLINRCSRRYMAINSKSKSTNELDMKVRQLVSMINGMLAQNNGRVYTNDMYKQAEAAAQAREAEKLREAAEKDKVFNEKMEKVGLSSGDT
jgi:GTPase Era involved in 16S rRNA processing